MKAAALMLVADNDEIGGANPEVARNAFRLAPEPKQLINIDGGHFGLLFYPSELFDQCSKAQADFFVKHL